MLSEITLNICKYLVLVLLPIVGISLDDAIHCYMHLNKKEIIYPNILAALYSMQIQSHANIFDKEKYT